MTTIDQRALVSPKAQLGDNVTIGPFAIVEDDVVIGNVTTIGSHALLANGTRVGKECRIHHGAVLGTVPQDLKFHGEATILEVGDATTIREYATLNRGTSDRGRTTVGSHCFIMSYAHIAHDCSVGNHVILANSVNMAGHVVIEDYVVIGGLVPIIHLGKPWLFFWLVPYPNRRLIWPNFRSPLVWDVFAVLTYFTISLLFWYVGLIPDMATLRDRSASRVGRVTAKVAP
mgnify:CR=1 FL=1